MYPQRELTRLAAHKAALRRNIAFRRVECFEAMALASQPLEWLDKIVALWHRVSPLALFATVPLGFLVKRAVSPRFKILSSLMRWGPLVFTALRGMRAGTAPRRQPAEFSRNHAQHRTP